MNEGTPRQASARIEAIISAAEGRASGRSPHDQSIDATIAQAGLDDAGLLEAASREAERCAVRHRMLTRELKSEGMWMILVDLLIQRLQAEKSRASDWGQRLGISEGTLARMIAGLIEEGLVGRDQRRKIEAEPALYLTETGFSVLRAVFSACR